MKTYPYYQANFAFPLFGKSYTGVVYRVDSPTALVVVRQSCGHNHRHPAAAKECAEAEIRKLEGAQP